MRILRLFILTAACIAVEGFVPHVVKRPGQALRTSGPNPFQTCGVLPFPVRRQRKSVANVQTMSFFGLGLPEIGVILIAGVVLLGPDKLGEMARSSGKMAAELKDEFKDVPEELKKIPEEFKQGMEEGEINARARKAKAMEPVPEEDAQNDKE